MALPLPFIGGVPTTEASILSKVASLFVGTQASAAENDVVGDNSQKMPLLEAPANPLALGASSTDAFDATALVSTLNLAQVSSSNVALSTENNTDSSKITNYKVKSGDTVSGIAQKFNISVNTVLWANNLRKDSTLAVGKNLIILPISGVTYTVKSGDTLQGIALKYNGDIQEIMSYNNMASDQIKIGDMVVIPDGEATDTSYSKPSTTVSKAKPSAGIANAVAKAVGINVANAESSDENIPNIPNNTTKNPANGYYMRPISAGTRTQGIHGNNAVDLADACGTPIYASAAGDITIAMSDGGWNGGYGNYVVISHANGSQTLYGHMSNIIVTEGSHVTQGQQIGAIGNTGKVTGATGCHVHFEIRNGPVNPF